MDESYHVPINNKSKVDFICQALRLDPATFNLDLPFPLEDWAAGDDLSLIRAGLFIADLRNQFYARLFAEHSALRQQQAWSNQADAEYWIFEFNRIIAKRTQGILISDFRALH